MQQRVVILQAKEQREHYLFVWIDHSAAYAIAIELKGTQPDPVAPLPHDLLKNVIDELEARLESVDIWDLQDDIFRGRLVLDAAGRRLEINARPADAIALALRARVPILVAEKVMERADVF